MRLAQHERSIARRLGTETLEELEQRLTRARELEQQEEQRRQASLTELERERERAARAEQRAQALEREREEALTQARLTEACAAGGVRNLPYARFLVETARRGGDQRPESELLAGYLADDAHRVALGVAQAAAPSAQPINTTPPSSSTPPSAPNGQAKDAMSMSSDEWRAERRRLGLPA